MMGIGQYVVGANGQSYQPDGTPVVNASGAMIGDGQDAARARTLGQQMGSASAYDPNYSGYTHDVGAQQSALGMMQSQASGTAPSQAQILGQQMIGSSLQEQLAGAASARGGPMAQAAAMRQASQNAAATQQQGTQQLSALRAQEQANATNAYAGQANAMGAQALQQTGMDVQNQQFQRGLNAQNQMGYEQMATGVDQSQAQLNQNQSQYQTSFDENANQFQQQLHDQHWAEQAALDQHATDRVSSMIGPAVEAGASALALMSDPASKVGVVDMSAPMASDDLMPATGADGTTPAWLDNYMSTQAAPAFSGSSSMDPGAGSSSTGDSASSSKVNAALKSAGTAFKAGMKASSKSPAPIYQGGRLPVTAAPAPMQVQMPMISDLRSKQMYVEATHPEEAEPARMMDGIGGGKAFRYRDGVPGADPTKQHFGTTTADLKKTPMGASMVMPGSPMTGGYEAIDTREAIGPTLAALGNLNQRMRMLEAERKGGR